MPVVCSNIDIFLVIRIIVVAVLMKRRFIVFVFLRRFKQLFVIFFLFFFYASSLMINIQQIVIFLLFSFFSNNLYIVDWIVSSHKTTNKIILWKYCQLIQDDLHFPLNKEVFIFSLQHIQSCCRAWYNLIKYSFFLVCLIYTNCYCLWLWWTFQGGIWI